MDFMTVGEIAATLRVKRSWVYTHADELGAYRIGKYLRFYLPRVLQCLDRMSGSPEAQLSNASLRALEFTVDKADRKQNANKNVD